MTIYGHVTWFYREILTFNNWNWIIFNMYLHSFQATPYMTILQEFWKFTKYLIITKYFINVCHWQLETEKIEFWTVIPFEWDPICHNRKRFNFSTHPSPLGGKWPPGADANLENPWNQNKSTPKRLILVLVKTLTLERFTQCFKSINKKEEILNGDWSEMDTWPESWVGIGERFERPKRGPVMVTTTTYMLIYGRRETDEPKHLSSSNGVFKHASCSMTS